MNDSGSISVHWSFWAISIFFLIWNIIGGVNFVMQMNTDMVASMPETHRAIIDSRPTWATAGFAVSVFIGALGCLLLLLRKSVAYYFLIASLIGTLITMIHTIRVANSTIKFNPVEITIMIILPIIVASFLIWYCKLAEKKGLLR